MSEVFENSNPNAIRRPPQSVKTEQAILGGLLVNNSALDSILDLLHRDDFCRRDHRIIYETIKKIIQQGRPADCLTVFDAIKNEGYENEVGGFNYLTELSANFSSAVNIRRYAEIVHDKATLRQLIVAGDNMVTAALSEDGRSTEEILDRAEREVLAINERNSRGRRGFQSMNVLVREVTSKIIEIHQSHEEGKSVSDVTGVATGYPNLDKVTAGLQRGDMIILAARPSMGKTALALNIAEYVGIRCRQPVAIFSMEMGADQLCQRLLASIGRLDSQRLRKGTLTDDEWDKFMAASSLMDGKPIFIDDTGSLTVSDLSSRARRLANSLQKPLGLIVVDYIQMMSGKGDNRVTILSEISRGLKALAKELHCPIIVLSQLSRAVETRTDHRPMMSDLRESGAIEQDADVIMFIYREARYNPNTENKNAAELIIAKQRNGPVGTLRMNFYGELTRFEAAADEGYYEG